MHVRARVALALSLPPLLAIACGGAPQPPSAAPLPPATSASSAPSPPPAAPTVDDARAFVDQVDSDLRDLWVARDRASWLSSTYITDDSEALAARMEQATAEYVTKKVHEARRFAGVQLPDDVG